MARVRVGAVPQCAVVLLQQQPPAFQHPPYRADSIAGRPLDPHQGLTHGNDSGQLRQAHDEVPVLSRGKLLVEPHGARRRRPPDQNGWAAPGGLPVCEQPCVPIASHCRRRGPVRRRSSQSARCRTSPRQPAEPAREVPTAVQVWWATTRRPNPERRCTGRERLQCRYFAPPMRRRAGSSRCIASRIADAFDETLGVVIGGVVNDEQLKAAHSLGQHAVD